MSYTEIGIVEMKLVKSFEEGEDIEGYLKNLATEIDLDCELQNNIIDCLNYEDSGYFFKNNKLYKIILKETMEELNPITINLKDRVLFICSYYNGGTDLNEMMIDNCNI